MEPEVFKQIVSRVKEYQKLKSEEAMKACICGLGEPLLHPGIVDFISYLAQNGISSSITSNGYLLDSRLAKKIIKAGLNEMCFSVSDIDDRYQDIHNLDFKVVKNNVLKFNKYAKHKCSVAICITVCNNNRSRIERLKEYWMSKGIYAFMIWEESNRGGARVIQNSITHTNAFRDKAEGLLMSRNIHPICIVPFYSVFIGWDGMYYMCCNDFEKRYPLGSVFDASIMDIRDIKIRTYEKGISICKLCSHDPVNLVRDMLLKIENKQADESDSIALIEQLDTISHTVYNRN